jgi:hypothetical protein
MHSSTLFSLGSALLLFPGLAVSSPITRRTPLEIVYLSNCDNPENGYTWSEVEYYPDYTQSWNGEYPPSLSRTQEGSFSQWTTSSVEAVFNDGNYFISQPQNGDAEVGAFSGYGANKYTQFVCYKDSDRLLYTGGAGDFCYTQFYCVDVDPQVASK